jgi:hypothetical protein
MGTLTPTGWIPPEEGMGFEQWMETGETLTRIGHAVKFARGDWLTYGEGRGDWGEMYTQAMDQTRLSYTTLSQEKWVAERVNFVTRDKNLSWTHHREVAPLDSPEEQAKFLEIAEQNAWDRGALREAVREYRKGGDKDVKRLEDRRVPCPHCSGTGWTYEIKGE